jgi:hypothetical protein
MGTSGKTAFDTGLGLSGRKKFVFLPASPDKAGV